MQLPLRALSLALLLAACQSTAPIVDQPSAESPWVDAFVAPHLIETDRMRLEPLAPRFNELDYAAAQGSREHLQTTLQWGGWPSAEMTPADNMEDLERHWGEFEEHEAYAYSVLAPAGEPCIGCVYLNPMRQEPRGIAMAFWVTEDQLALDLDRHLVKTMLDRIERSWPVDVVVLPIPTQNERGIATLTELGLELVRESEGLRVFAWRRSGE